MPGPANSRGGRHHGGGRHTGKNLKRATYSTHTHTLCATLQKATAFPILSSKQRTAHLPPHSALTMVMTAATYSGGGGGRTPSPFQRASHHRSRTRNMSFQYLLLDNGRPLPATCHAWNRDLSQLAFCPNSNTIRIHSVGKDGKLGELVQELVDHDKLVTSLSWCPTNNRLVSCSQDRNAFVWSLNKSGQFEPELVSLRVKNACTDVKWSPCEKKFAVATGAKHIALCHYVIEDEASGTGLWHAKHIGNHGSTVLSVDWHPSSCMLASGSSDQWCRIFMSAVKKVDAKPPPMFGLSANKAGKPLTTGDVLARRSRLLAGFTALHFPPQALTLRSPLTILPSASSGCPQTACPTKATSLLSIFPGCR